MNKLNCPCCKYIFERDYCDGKKENNFIIIGDEPPILLRLSNGIAIINEDDDNIHLYACPKCKTVTFDKSW